MELTTKSLFNYFVAVAALAVAYYFSGSLEVLAASLPLVALCAGDGAGDGCCGASTPYICTWNGSRFSLDNDFLFGKPISYFANKQIAIGNYESGKVTGDKYKIQNDFELKDGKLAFQIREIEPEESYIDFLSLKQYIYPKNTELVVSSNLLKTFMFNKDEMEKNRGVSNQKITWNGQDFSDKIGKGSLIFNNVADQGYPIDKNKDVIEIKANISNLENGPYLIVKSFYRDWPFGKIFDEVKTSQGISIREMFSSIKSPSDFVKVGAMIVFVSMVSMTASIGSLFKSETSNTVSDANELSSLFSVKSALADTPWTCSDTCVGTPPSSTAFSGDSKSIITEFWNGEAFIALDVLSPRYFQMSLNAVQIPDEAVLEGGEICLRITATRKHRIGYLGLLAPSSTIEPKVENLKVTKAYHSRDNKDYSSILNAKNSKEYLHTIPADVVDVEFELPSSSPTDNEKQSFVLEANGVYTNLSSESEKLAGDWLSKLDPEDRSWLKSMSEANV